MTPLEAVDLDGLEEKARAAPGKKWAITAGFLELDGRQPLFQLFGHCPECDEPTNPIVGNPGEPESAAAYIAAANPETVLLLIQAARERDGLREAMTASADTKAAYAGEFKMRVVQNVFDEDGELEEVAADITIEWTTIKEIMAAIELRARQALSTNGGGK